MTRRPAPKGRAKAASAKNGLKRLPPEERRREIVLKAAEFFSQFDFDAGTRDFAKFIGLTQPIITATFPPSRL